MKELYSQRFDTLQDFILTLAKDGHWGEREKINNEEANPNESITASDSWAGASYDESIGMLTNGWKEGRKKMEEFQRGISNDIKPRDIAPVGFFDVAGDECDISRFLSGDPENMLDFKFQETSKQGRIIKLMVQGWIHAGGNQAQMLRRGAAALAIADALEDAGYRVELELYFYNSESNAHSMFYVPVKESDQDLQVDRLTYLFCHVSVMRRLWFRIVEQMEPKLFHKFIHKHYGTMASVPKSLMDEGSIWLTTDHLFNSDEDAVKFVNETLEPYADAIESD